MAIQFLTYHHTHCHWIMIEAEILAHRFTQTCKKKEIESVINSARNKNPNRNPNPKVPKSIKETNENLT